ncbi:MAG: helix-turn-helix domain-containing protein, partial [Lachnospiraceae bacterium]|nr:helix-turn-helix domain-containing protein [Lachnospiraceae bacterium]
VYWKCLQDMSSSSLVKERFFRLEKYDRKHGTSLRETLRVYLDHDRNLARTSDELYIHRSTLQYRLEKIENLTGFDLSDPETRFQLLFTYRLLDWEQQ